MRVETIVIHTTTPFRYDEVVQAQHNMNGKVFWGNVAWKEALAARCQAHSASFFCPSRVGPVVSAGKDGRVSSGLPDPVRL